MTFDLQSLNKWICLTEARTGVREPQIHACSGNLRDLPDRAIQLSRQAHRSSSESPRASPDTGVGRTTNSIPIPTIA